MLHLNKFIDRVEGHDAKGSRDFVMPMSDARALHADITRLLTELVYLRNQPNETTSDKTIEVKIAGGKF